jgi:hypothetical protein
MNTTSNFQHRKQTVTFNREHLMRTMVIVGKCLYFKYYLGCNIISKYDEDLNTKVHTFQHRNDPFLGNFKEELWKKVN